MSEKFQSGTKTPKTNGQTNKRFNRPSMGYMYEGYITMSTKVCNMVIPIIRIALMIYLIQIPYIVLHIHAFITPILLNMSILNVNVNVTPREGLLQEITLQMQLQN